MSVGQRKLPCLHSHGERNWDQTAPAGICSSAPVVGESTLERRGKRGRGREGEGQGEGERMTNTNVGTEREREESVQLLQYTYVTLYRKRDHFAQMTA